MALVETLTISNLLQTMSVFKHSCC